MKMEGIASRREGGGQAGKLGFETAVLAILRRSCTVVCNCSLLAARSTGGDRCRRRLTPLSPRGRKRRTGCCHPHLSLSLCVGGTKWLIASSSSRKRIPFSQSATLFKLESDFLCYFLIGQFSVLIKWWRVESFEKAVGRFQLRPHQFDVWIITTMPLLLPVLNDWGQSTANLIWEIKSIGPVAFTMTTWTMIL